MKRNLLIFLLVCMCSSGLRAQTLPPYLPASGLQAWFPFNGNATDESNNGNVTTITNATLTTDRHGNSNSAYSFTSNKRISVTAPTFTFQVTGTFSVSYWANPTTGGICWFKGNSVGGYFDQYSHISASGVPYFNCNSQGSAWQRLAATTGFNPGWNHVVCTYNNRLMSIYVNGVARGTMNFTPNPTNFNTPFFMGNDYTGTAGFVGELDDFAIWDRVLTPAEILALASECQLTFTTQPLDFTGIQGDTARFVVEASDLSAAYQWQYDNGTGWKYFANGGQYSGVSNDTLEVYNLTNANHNQHFRCITLTLTCIDTSAIATIFVNGVGIGEQHAANQVFISPNPARDLIEIAIPLSLIGKTYFISDLLGRKVMESVFTESKQQIDISPLASGNYQVHFDDDASQTLRFIKE